MSPRRLIGMRVLFAGTPAVALPTLQAILNSDHDVVGVLTRPPARAGRKRALLASPVQEFAEEVGLPVITSDRPHQPDTVAAIRELAPEVAAVVAYGGLVREPALSLPERGWINLHFSLLPAWRGAAPVQHAIRAGDQITGATTFWIEAGLDTGPVLGTLTEQIRARDTSGDLLERLAEAGGPLMVATLDAVADGTADAQPQPATGISHAPRLTTAQAQLDWSQPAFAVDRSIRAFTPAPGPWTMLAGGRVKIGPVQPLSQGPQLAPGEILAEPQHVLVGTGTTPVRLGQLAQAGKGWMAAADWARGARPAPGTRFEWGTS